MGTSFCKEVTQNSMGSIGSVHSVGINTSRMICLPVFPSIRQMEDDLKQLIVCKNEAPPQSFAQQNPSCLEIPTDLEESIHQNQQISPLGKFVNDQTYGKVRLASNNLLLSSQKRINLYKAQNPKSNPISLKDQQIPSKQSPPILQYICETPVITNSQKANTYKRIGIDQENFITLKKEDIYQQYKRLEYLGKGAYGKVYKAISIRDGSIRAIKIIKRHHFVRDCAKQAEFFAELELLRKVDHPNIIKLFDVYESPQSYFVVTEYCGGGSLIEYLNERNFLNENIVRAIIHQILECLNYIHRLQIVHRDIKLQNIVLLKQLKNNSQSEEVEIKLLDFGEAVLIKNPRTNIKNIVGTIGYVAPEMIQGFFNEKCDIWSAGVVLFMLVTSLPPFKHKKQEVTFERVLKLKLNYDQPVWSRISPQVKALTRAMLERNLSERVSAKEALSHSWFKHHTLSTSIQVPSYFDKLLQYNVQNNLISVVESYLAYRNVSQDDRNQIAAVFKAIDTNNDGLIDRAELIAQCTELKLSQQIKVEELITRLDKDKSGLISLSEFITAVVSREKLFKRPFIEEAFDHFDSKKQGYLSKETLTSLLKGGDREQIDDLLFEMDEDEDGKVSKREFVNYFMDNGYLFDSNGRTVSTNFVQ